jgi:hypothetical protein
MKTRLVFQIAALLSLATNSIAATVEYQYPDLTIVAEQEPLESVLKSVGREMRIFVTIPAGLDTVVKTNIQHQPIKQAFKNLLGDLDYSLVWAKGGERLLGLTIFAGGGEAAVAAVSDSPSHKQSAAQVAPSHEARIEAEPEESEARMIEEEEAQEAQEAQEARISEAIERHDAETAAYLESQGINLPR